MRVNYLLAIILAVLLFGLGGIISPPAEAATFTVNATADAVDAIPGDGLCQTATPGQCTLRAAIMETNALPGTHTIIPAGRNLCLNFNRVQRGQCRQRRPGHQKQPGYPGRGGGNYIY